ILVSGIALLFCGVITARSKPDLLTFVFLRVDPAEEVAILRPMIAPDIGVQLDSGPKELKRGTVLHCTPSTREQSAIVEGHIAKISELWLDCGDQKFVVKGLDLSPGR